MIPQTPTSIKNMSYSIEELNEAFEKIPEPLQDAMASVDTARIINNVGKKYNLHIDQIGALSEEAGYVLLGLTHPTEFVSSLTKRLGVGRVVASQIASDINEQIFLKFRDIIKDAQKGRKRAEEESEGEPRPSKDALLAALEHPEGMLKKPAAPQSSIPLVKIPNPYQPAKPELGRDVPVVAPIPAGPSEGNELPTAAPAATTNPEPTAVDILKQRLTSQVTSVNTETRVETGQKFDPYREIPV